MVKANRKPKSAKGAVLIMVLTIMFVLIFMLAGTMAVVYSANNRALAKYEESQGYYSARSVLDMFGSDFLYDDTNDAQPTSKAHYFDPSGNPITTVDNITQARALEFELYKLNVDTSSDFYTNYVSTNGTNSKLLINANNTVFPTSDSVYKQYAPSTSYGDTYTYTIDSADLSAYASGYGKVIDGGSNVTLTVQLLERTYDIGSAVLSGTETDSEIAALVQAGSREKDQFKIKVTASVIYDSNQYSTSCIYKTGAATPVNSGSAIDATGGLDMGGAGASAFGGMTSLSDSTTTFMNNSTNTGSLFTRGGVNFDSQASYRFSAGEGAVVLGDMNVKGGTKITSSGDESYVYVYGDYIDNEGNVTIGDAAHSVDLIVNGEFKSASNPSTINGNLYCGSYTPKNSNENTINGDLYVKDVKISPQYYTPNYAEDGTTVLSYTVNYNGGLNINYESLTLVDWSGNSVAPQTTAGVTGMTQLASNSIKIDYYDQNCYNYSTSDKTKTLSLVTMGAPVEYDLPTSYALYDTKFIDGSFYEDDTTNPGYVGEIATTDTGSSLTTWLANHVVTIDDSIVNATGQTLTDHKIATSVTLSASNSSASSHEAITAGTYTLPGAGGSGAMSAYYLDIDTSGGDVIFQIDCSTGALNGEFNVVGPNSVYFLIPGSDNAASPTTYQLGGTDFGMRVLYYGEDPSNPYTDPYEVNNGITTGAALSQPPKIYYWGSGYSNINIAEGANSTFFAGYWNAPLSNIKVDTNLEGGSTHGLNDNISYTHKSFGYGSITAGSFSCGQKTSFDYVDPNVSSKPANKRNFTWNALVYTAS